MPVDGQDGQIIIKVRRMFLQVSCNPVDGLLGAFAAVDSFEDTINTEEPSRRVLLLKYAICTQDDSLPRGDDYLLFLQVHGLPQAADQRSGRKGQSPPL